MALGHSARRFAEHVYAFYGVIIHNYVIASGYFIPLRFCSRESVSPPSILPLLPRAEEGMNFCDTLFLRVPRRRTGTGLFSSTVPVDSDRGKKLVKLTFRKHRRRLFSFHRFARGPLVRNFDFVPIGLIVIR